MPPRISRALDRFRPGPGSFKVDFAIEGSVPWADEASPRAGTVHLGGGLDIGRANGWILDGFWHSPFVPRARRRGPPRRSTSRRTSCCPRRPSGPCQLVNPGPGEPPGEGEDLHLHAADRIEAAARELAGFRAAFPVREVALMREERLLTQPQGLPGRPWFKHQVYAPGINTGYAAQFLPGIRDALEAGDAATVTIYRDLLLDSLRRATATASNAAGPAAVPSRSARSTAAAAATARRSARVRGWNAAPLSANAVRVGPEPGSGPTR